MKHQTRLLGTLCLLATFGLAGCGDKANPPSVNGDAATDTSVTDTPATDTPVTPTDAPATGASCTTYCAEIMGNCTGANAQYDDMASCMSFCAAARWPAGDATSMAGNNLNCRIYHGGAPAIGDPGMHCPHAGPSGYNVCGSVSFRGDAPSMYRRVDRMGMPAVSTALLPAARKNAYNDVTSDVDMAGFVGDIATHLTELHTMLDRHLIAANLTPCSMTQLVGTQPECLGQNYAPGATVASLIVPHDSILVNPANAAGFPNGRRLQDPVIDVTLAVLLLRVGPGGTCNAMPCSATSLATIPLNPRANDQAFLDTFPYLAPAQAPH